MSAAAGLLRPALEKIDARIAVSENARSMMVQHIGGEAVVIPNGLYTAHFKGVRGGSGWAPTARSASSAGWTSIARGSAV